jgi:ABC-2 type transport system ATP-binding protein
MEIIRVEKLRKVYKVLHRQEGARVLKNLVRRQWDEKLALDDIDMSVQEGEIIGYIGPNGAGKSTTIKIMAGVLYPTAGRVLAAGIEPYREKRRNARTITLVMGQRTILLWDLPVRDSLVTIRHMYKMPMERWKRNRDDLCDLLGVGEFYDTPVKQLSLGQRMRAEFAVAMLHEPRIAYLDEPTIGLDIVAKDAIREFIRDANRRTGMTVIFTSHDVVDIERLCTRVLVIDRGKIVYSGDTETLKRRYCGQNCEMHLLLREPRATLSVPGFRCEPRGDRHVLYFNRGELTPSDVIYRLAEQGVRLADFSLKEPTFEEAVKLIYRG